MHSPKRPRPVPSPAALRLLTQLAYISSGTALGLATLCAEERRRRIKICQRIADNARVLRSHPRYVGNVAAVRREVEGEEGGWIAQMSGQGGFEDGRRKSRWTRRMVDDLQEDRGAMAPDLPSVVERGYERVVQEDEGGVLRNRQGVVINEVSVEARPVVYAPFVGYGKDAQAEDTGWHDVRSSRSEHPRPQPLEVETKGMSESRLSSAQSMIREATPLPDSWTDRIYKRTRRRDGFALRPVKDVPRVEGLTDVSRSQVEDDGPTGRLEDPDGPDTSALRSSDSNPPVTRESQNASVSTGEKPSADHHLEKAIRNGSLNDIRSIYLRKLSAQSTTPEDFRLLTRSMAALGDRLPQDQVLQFYLELFRSDDFCALENSFRFKTKAIFLADVATQFERHEMLQLTTSLMRPETKDVPLEAIRERIDAAVQELLLADDPTKAGRLFLLLHAAAESVLPPSEWDELWNVASQIIDRCTSKGEVALTTRLLQRFYYRISASDPTSADRLLQNVLKGCGERKAYPAVKRMLLYMDRRGQEPWELAAKLDDRCKVIVATAFSYSTDRTRHQVIFESLYKLLPQDDRQALIESTKIKTMKDNWRSTRNLEAAELEYSTLRQWLIENHDRRSTRQLDRAMIEIHLFAGKVQTALGKLARMRGTSLDSETVSLAALILAKKKAWDDVEKLKNFAQENKLLTWTFETTGIWDKIIHLHCLSNTPLASQTFVRDLVTRFGFGLGRAAVNTVLRSCVEHRSLDLIPGWIKYVKSVGSDFELDGDVAARLFTSFWTHGRLGRRMKHRSIMWHCYFLQRCIPKFDLQSFKNLLRESIGYDLRNRYEQDLGASNPRPNVVERLRLVENAVDKLPAPDGSVAQSKSEAGEVRTDEGLGDEDADASATSLGIAAPEAIDSIFQQQVQYIPAVDETREQEELHRSAGAQATSGHHPSPGSLAIKTLAESNRTSHTDEQMALRDRTNDRKQTGETRRSKTDHRQFGFYLPSEIPIMEHNDDRHFHDAVNTFPSEVREDIHQERFREEVSMDESNWNDSLTEDGDQIQPLERQNDDLDVFEQSLHAEEEDPDSLDTLLSTDKSQQNGLERSMVTAMSLRDYQKVLELYQNSIDRRGIPATPRSLEIALQASLRLRGGDAHEAEQLLVRAQEAGMDISCAMGPMIIHRMRSMKSMNRGDANRLRMMVLDYYRSNDTNGRPISHHIATTAAHQLITNRAAEHGINLLTAIFTSEWAAQRPLDTATMTLLLHGYIKIRSLNGMQWTVQNMLNNNLWISRRFMRELKQTFKPSRDPYWASRFKKWPAEQEARLREWAQTCHKRRIEQIGQDFKMGLKLRWLIKQCVAEQGWVVNVDYQMARKEVEAADLGERKVDLEWLRPRGYHSVRAGIGEGFAGVPKNDVLEEHVSDVRLVEVASR